MSNYHPAKLPRELLWKEQKHMTFYFKLDPINKELYDVFLTFKDKSSNLYVRDSAIRVFNELYYFLLRIDREHPWRRSDVERYFEDIGYDYYGFSDEAADIIIMMAYWILSRREEEAPLYSTFCSCIKEKYESSYNLYWHTIEKHLNQNKAKTIRTKKLAPQPLPVAELKESDINWNDVTCGYDIDCVIDVLLLYKNDNDWKELLSIIYRYGVDKSSYVGYEKIEHLWRLQNLIEYIGSIYTEKYCVELKEDKIQELENENDQLKARISELKKINGISEGSSPKVYETIVKKERTFSFQEIVDFCRNRMTWGEAKSIVMMLQRFILGNATEEEKKMIDSISDPNRYNRSIVNKFGAGSQNQVFNGSVSGDFKKED